MNFFIRKFPDTLHKEVKSAADKKGMKLYEFVISALRLVVTSKVLRDSVRKEKS